MKYEEIPESLAKYIATRDKRLAKDAPWSPAQVSERFKALLSTRRVNFGGRSTCGSGKQDPTWTSLCAWRETVSKARSFGFIIAEIPIKQKNKSPTTSGGYWHESEYLLVATPE